MRRITVMACVLGVTIAGIIATWLIVGGDSERSFSYPEGLVVVTPAPDTRSAVSADIALSRLQQDANLSRVVAAVRGGDVDAFLELIAWTPKTCTAPDSRGVTEACGGTLVAGDSLPMVNVGDTGEFWLTANTLRGYLDVVLAGTTLELRYQGDSKHDSGEKYLGFEGHAKALNFPPIGSPDARLTGVFLVVDAEADTPIQRLSMLLDTYGARERGIDSLGEEDQTIVTLTDSE